MMTVNIDVNSSFTLFRHRFSHHSSAFFIAYTSIKLEQAAVYAQRHVLHMIHAWHISLFYRNISEERTFQKQIP